MSNLRERGIRNQEVCRVDTTMRTMELVNVLGMASKNHKAKPRMKPFLSALTLMREIDQRK